MFLSAKIALGNLELARGSWLVRGSWLLYGL